MKVVWSPYAIDDLVAIRSYIAKHNPLAANDIARRILHAVSLLAEHPQLGIQTHRTDVRRLIVKNSPYIIPYRVMDGELEILEVFDGRQSAPRTDLETP
jgi:toxin ParE1/3/4